MCGERAGKSAILGEEAKVVGGLTWEEEDCGEYCW